MGQELKNESEILSAVAPLLKLLCLTAFGVILGHPETQIVPRSTFKLLSKLVFALFLPCLIFVQLGQAVTLSDILNWWFVPANVVISTIIGFILGYIVALICRPPPQYFRFTVVMTGFGNTGNLPIALVGSVCHGSNNIFGPSCSQKGIAYVSFAQWVAVILVYTFVYHMMEPPRQYYEIVAEDDESEEVIMSSNNLSRPLLHYAEWPRVMDRATESTRLPLISRVFGSVSSSQNSLLDSVIGEEVGANTAPSSPKSLNCLAEPRLVRRIRVVAKKTPIDHILQPPTIASLLALVVGLVPMFKGVVFGDDAPLAFFTDSLDILASAMVPSVMLILGGMLAEGPNESSLGIRTTIGITVARLLVLPLFGIGVVTLADQLNLLVEGDKMYRFVLLLQYTTPSAILLGAIASLRGYAVKEASALLFWQHVSAVLSLSVYIVIYYKLLTRV